MEDKRLKIRHMLLALLAVLAIAFMQPLVSFLGGLTLLLGVGGLIFRDLSPASQDAVERRLLGWLRRARAGSPSAAQPPVGFDRRLPVSPAETAMPVERVRRVRVKPPVSRPAASGPPLSNPAGEIATGDDPPPPTA